MAVGFTLLGLLYASLIREVAHRTIVALFFASVTVAVNLVLRFTDFRSLFDAIDLDTILLLMCMMILVGVMSRTGVFSYIAASIVKRMHSRPFAMIAVLSAITASVSAFIDNVTTVLMVTPIIIEIGRKLRIDPKPVLLSVVFASNIGGTATLIGDPPNIIIGSATGLGFTDFLENLTPAVLVSFAIYLLVIRVLFSGWLRSYGGARAAATGDEEEELYIRRGLLIKVLLVFGFVITLFLLEDTLGYPPAIPPIIGAGVLLLVVKDEFTIEEALRSVDWTTLVFFMSMFIVIKGVEDLGVMDFIANQIALVGGGINALLLLIVWVSAVVSAFVDNIPFVMSMIPVISSVAAMTHVNPVPLYWALSLGGCLGGNGTLVGASANVVVAGVAERYGRHISFAEFIKYGMPVMLATVAASSAYLILRYGII